jgi:hypothetical protein
MTRKFFLAVLLFCCIIPLSSQTFFTVNGQVTDDSTGELLAAVNVRLLGTAKGTITNVDGRYTLTVEQGEHTLVFSILSYRPETLRVDVQENLVKNIRLKPLPIEMAEIVVLAEDPAIEIIRQAIKHKREWMNKLKSYRFEAFTRQILRRDTAIASIAEAYTTGYMLVGDTLREVVKQKRQTENIPGSANFAAVRGIINFNEDEINLFRLSVGGNSSSYTFVGPTAPSALEYYDYQLIGKTYISDVEVYTIRMRPKTNTRPLFDGTISIAEGTYAVMGVDVKPNETFVLPFVKDIDLQFKQQFSLYDSIFWMPTNIRISGGLTVRIVGFSLPRIGLEQTSVMYDYAVNVPIPDSILQKPRLSVDSTATAFDSTFWEEHHVLPLTEEEKMAFATLDSTQTLEQQFEPKGPLASLASDNIEDVLGIIDARFNRVEGFFFGGRFKSDSLIQQVSLTTSAGYGFSDNVFKYHLGGTYHLTRKQSVNIGAEVYRKLMNVPDGDFYSPLTISLMALVDKNDYRDYYLGTGWKSFINVQPTRRMSATLGFLSENQTTMNVTSNYSFFSRNILFRPNPPILEGTMRSIQLDVRLGPQRTPFDVTNRNALEISVEYSSSSLGSNFDFTRSQALLQWNIKTFLQSLLFPPLLKVNLTAGTSSGTLPPQRFFTADTRASGYAPFGTLRGGHVKEFVGDRFVMLNLEHNFRSVPFVLLDIPFLYRNGIELVVHGSAAQTWLGNISTSSGWYYEAGMGINRILDIIRADLSYRLKEPRRFYFTLSIANIF